MTVKKVYVQLGDDGMPIAPCGYALWEGARFLDLKPQGYHIDRIHTLDLDETTLVHGWVKAVHLALLQIGRPIPPPLDYPEELNTRQILGRRIWRSTLEEVHRIMAGEAERLEGLRRIGAEAIERRVFIKPVEHKLFTGHTIERFSDLAETENMDKGTPVWASDIVEFVSEFRCFVHEGALLGVHRYCGDNWVLPNKQTVIQMIRAYRSAPVAYSLDVGVTKEGATYLVEVNDWYALGNYALGSLPYTEAAIARWEQMAARPITQPLTSETPCP